MLQDPNYFKLSRDDKSYFLEEVAAATKTGVYSIYFKQDKFYMDAIGRSILNVPDQINPSISEASKLFFNKQDFVEMLDTCLSGKPFEADIALNSFNQEKIWMRFTAKPKYNRARQIVAVRGIFTSIDKYIRNQEKVKQHSEIIKAQNERLLHFAHIVSHNLRSQSSNLALTLELFNDIKQDERSAVFYSYLEEISISLSTTLKHLNQVVTLNSQATNRKFVDINECVKKVLENYSLELERIDAEVQLDFTAFNSIEYVSSFLQGILDTLISNAIENRSQDRPLIIKICTKITDGKKLLMIKDNGCGMDINSIQSQLFKIDHKEHPNGKTKGLGLFLAKNQVEALGGDIVVKSKKDKGAKFTIKL
ncbi:Signal transduction histidine kinase [Nonlabens sp. Hel1_33_55]|uniref:ATP-binding protein n=1 Tax=Nonlabens sp. Hel1_33_55 TaxID=1336802 RepID=UPI000875BE2B|nr:HAMP domain-containing sensor histidine kinase [Nonlabens sp. Hel1_33_55]SCY26963.1 Signal transduction histidine kinase [Nonlabens sp. Hel1_33_55]